MRKRRTRRALKRDCPRLSVWRTNRYVSAQVIDDRSQKTIAFASSRGGETEKMKKSDAARAVGKTIAEKARKAGVTKVVFDRSRYAYHGNIKALAEGAREAGLEF